MVKINLPMYTYEFRIINNNKYSHYGCSYEVLNIITKRIFAFELYKQMYIMCTYARVNQLGVYQKPENFTSSFNKNSRLNDSGLVQLNIVCL